jgi:hypothetical protein
MGSFFDRSLDDKVLDSRFTDVSQWAALLRSWDSR